MQLVSAGDSLHEMPKPIFFGKNKKTFQNIAFWNFTQHAV